MPNVNGTTYLDGDNFEVIKALEYARLNHKRVRMFYGNVATGRDWGEEWGTIGYIGRSMGPSKVPLLIPNSRSMGGASILVSCIVKLTVKEDSEYPRWRTMYQHPRYKCGTYKIATWSDGKVRVLRENDAGYFDVFAKFSSLKRAEKYIAFMTGKSNTKGGR